ncbi:MAG: hypothetical protein LBC10_01785, partial [Deltaproteobacteria bacterium]|nr:hypothetical protein [Deltaproteobacteria bacterium]
NQLKALFPSWVDPDPVHSSKGRGNAWWVGLTGEITTADPFRFAWDFNYGSVNMGRAVQRNDDGTSTDRDGNIKRAGWYAALLAEYKLDCATPGLAGWYGSGDGKNWKKGSHMLPMIAASSKLTSFGQDGADFDMPCTGLQTGLAGTWGLVAQVKDVSLLEDLSHTLRAAYYRGTNHTNNAGRRGGPMQSPWANTDADTAYLYMTTRDTAWEFNCDTSYTIYENLSAGLELGYIKLNINESIWGKDNKKQSRNMYKIAVGMTYSF